MAIDDSPTQAEVSWLDDQLDVFNAQQSGRDDSAPLQLVIRKEEDIIAGLKALTGWDWLYVQVLWVHQVHNSVASSISGPGLFFLFRNLLSIQCGKMLAFKHTSKRKADWYQYRNEQREQDAPGAGLYDPEHNQAAQLDERKQMHDSLGDAPHKVRSWIEVRIGCPEAHTLEKLIALRGNDAHVEEQAKQDSKWNEL
jgi:hypothetical protein